MTQQTWYRGGRTAMAAYAHLMLDLTIARHAALPAGPKLLVANHPTTTDPVLVPLAVEEPMHILITGMCFRMPGLGGYLRRAGHVPVVAGQGHEAFEAALALLRAGLASYKPAPA
jgi:1-acyl-sn-glycerol-3-phosphate acyltransferase